MSSYNLSPKSVLKMEDILAKLTNNNINRLEFSGKQTIATYLRQAMVAAEYLNDEKYGRLNKQWTISYHRNGTVICKRKELTAFREYKTITGIVEAFSVLDQNQDASVLYFPFVKPTEINGKVNTAQQSLLDTYESMYPLFHVNKFNHAGLVISRRSMENGK